MHLIGKWKNESDNTIMEILDMNESDYYSVRIFNKDKVLVKEEKLHIYISNNYHALIPHSQIFGRNEINFISVDKIQVGNLIFNKIR